jgi:signal transduction histidine kinase
VGLVVLDEDGIVVAANDGALSLLDIDGLEGSRLPFPLDGLEGSRLPFPLDGEESTVIDLRDRGGGVWHYDVIGVEVELAGRPYTVVGLWEEAEPSSDAAEPTDASARVETMQGAFAEAAHEIKNPVAAILLATHTLRRQWEELSEEDRTDFVGRIERQARSLDRLADQLLHMARIDAGRRPSPEIFDVAGVVYSRMGDFVNDPSAVRLTCPTGIRAHADPDHFWRMLVNYLENAFKHGAPPVEIVVTKTATAVEVRVCDRGAGVAPEFVPRLFERFARSDESSGWTHGLGLGLALVRDVARLNGGGAWYEPRNGGGACFAIAVPRAG